MLLGGGGPARDGGGGNGKAVKRGSGRASSLRSGLTPPRAERASSNAKPRPAVPAAPTDSADEVEEKSSSSECPAGSEEEQRDLPEPSREAQGQAVTDTERGGNR